MNKQALKLNSIIEKHEFSYESLFENDVTIHKYEINCSNLIKPNYEEKGLGYTTILPIIHDLMNINKPCVYWFETEKEEVANNLINDLNCFRELKTERSVPARNNKTNSKYIYVGIRQGGQRKDGFTNIAGRISIHFGYYKVGSTQGLQLSYWAKDKLILNVMEMPETAAPFLNVIEKQIANKLRPLCGRH